MAAVQVGGTGPDLSSSNGYVRKRKRTDVKKVETWVLVSALVLYNYVSLEKPFLFWTCVPTYQMRGRRFMVHVCAYYYY